MAQEYLFLGTPLEELDEDEIPRKKFQPDLTVRDAQGRRRFHGAFTGGFSAGYFNTVGTKEGWTPSTYKSSKTNKSENVAASRPEEFMDEEDLGEFGIAPQRIQVRDDFVDFTEQRKRLREPPRIHQGPIPGSPPLKNLFKPVSRSIGVKLLNKMGWRQGQGIGERVKRAKPKQAQAEPGVKVYGCALPPGTESSGEEDEFAAEHSFAPADVDDVLYVPKDNQHGIGYVPLDKHSVLSAPIDFDQPTTTRCHLEKSKRKLAITGQAFGVGAFEEDDSDIYAREDMSQYSFELTDEPEDKPRKVLPAIEGGRSKSIHQLTKTLEGFHLAKEPPLVMKFYPPPKIPADFQPIHKAPKRERRRFEEPKSELCKDKKTEHSGSVFDLISPADKERLESIKKTGSTEIVKATVDSSKTQPPLHVSQKASSTNTPSPVPVTEPGKPMKPFARDEAKQRRFEQYLSLMNSNRLEVFSAMQPVNMTEWEKERERKEFQRAAMICQPSQGLGSRFVSTRTLKDDDTIDVPIDRVEETPDAAKAAQLGMFGKLTHDEFEWHPVDLLCRRFNVPNPYPNCSRVGLETVAVDKHTVFNFLTPVNQEKEPNETSNVDEGPVAGTETAGSGAEVTSTVNARHDNEEDSSDASEEERPPLEFFKSIFSESSDDEENVDSKPTLGTSTVDEEAVAGATNTKKSPDEAAEQPSRPALGVFANLDFEQLNRRAPPAPLQDMPSNPPTSTVTCASSGEMTSSQSTKETSDSSIYGPMPPPQPIGSSCSTITAPSIPAIPQGSSKVQHSHKHKRKDRKSKSEKKHKKKLKSKLKKKKHKKYAKQTTVRKGSQHESSEEDETSDSSDEELPTSEKEPSYRDIMSRLEKLRKLM
uniref:G patch domain-containing protein 1 n=1 Tax=Rhipicephalus appendiculatus TaxID=34631 RepID=A0A131Z3L8_RHIAP